MSESQMDRETQQILVIDNNVRHRNLCERALSEEGFAVTAVAEGFSAIRAMASCRFVLAVVAVELPGMLDGLATMRQLRVRQPWLRALFTGKVSGWPWWWSVADSDEFIAAPFHRHDLLGCVFELLQRDVDRASRREHHRVV
jgi:two-component system, OmpR family, phosphate regulon response regulator OmpR